MPTGVYIRTKPSHRKLPRETRVCACGCTGTFVCKVNSTQEFLHGHHRKGTTQSKETCEKIGKSNSISKSGVKQTPEHSKKISESLTGRVKSLEECKKTSMALKGRTYVDLHGEEKAKEIKGKLSIAQSGEKSHLYGKHPLEETIRRMRCASLNRTYTKPNPCFNTSNEIKMKGILSELNIPYKFQQNLYGLKVDFVLTELLVVIECDGDYYHCNPKMYAPDYFNKKVKKYAWQIWERDRNRDKILHEAGYKTLRFWEKNFNEEIVKEAIEKKCYSMKGIVC